MKISVSYGEKTYGNSVPSEATEVEIYGSQKCIIKVDFKAAKPGKSWDWLTRGAVGGAEIELDMQDAKALAQLILDYAEVAETHDPMEYDISGVAKLQKGKLAKIKVSTVPY